MKKNMRSELFFLKQFGFSEELLNYIYINQFDPIEIIFNDSILLEQSIYEILTPKDRLLANEKNKYIDFKNSLFNSEIFLQKNGENKIYFKYDNNLLSNLLPEKVRPLFMYSRGDYTLLGSNKKRIAIVGTRIPSENTINITKKLTKKFIDDDYIIVSGLAEGVDTVSHEVALNSFGKTIAILPTNFKTIYPKKNKLLAEKILKNGLLLTAIGPSEHTYKSSFLDRNKYVANISDIILVTETNLKSGTMNTIRHASEANKKILYVNQNNVDINDKIRSYGGKLIYD